MYVKSVSTFLFWFHTKFESIYQICFCLFQFYGKSDDAEEELK